MIHDPLKPVLRVPAYLLSLALSTTVIAKEDQSFKTYRPEMSDEFKAMLRNADTTRGEDLFMRKCSSCHDYRKTGGNGKGPHLWNVITRKAGTREGFTYSDAMKQSGHEWTLANIDYYLTRTDRAVPGLAMNFRGIKSDRDRADLIGFLRLQADRPVDLP